MTDDNISTTVVRERSSGWVAPVVVLVAVLAVAAIAVGWKGLSYAQETRQTVNSDIQALKQGYAKDIDSVQQRLTQTETTNSSLQTDLDTVTKKLRITQADLKKAREEARQETELIGDESNQKIAAMDNQVTTQLATKASTDDVKVVSTEVGGVRTDLDATRKDLQMARSEMGTLIAKNHDDIETLRRLGERDYVEFTIATKNVPQKVGDATIELRGTDPKKNQCNLALVVDDKRTERRNRSINEPIFFYAHGDRRPSEVVINQVEKNKVSGYLSVPKGTAQPLTAGGN
jgi:hypothetical protein